MLAPPKMSPETSPLRLGLLIGLAGFCGVVSTLLIDMEQLIQLLPVKVEVKITPGLKALSLLQPTVLVAIAVVVGLFATKRTGLHAPVFEAVTRREPWLGKLGRAVPLGVAGGIVGGMAIIALNSLVHPQLPAGVALRVAKFMSLMPLPTRLLYGGLTEEVLLRWGFMSGLVWVGWRVAAKHSAVPPAWCFVAAIVVSAVVFGAGHLPMAYVLIPSPSAALVCFIIAANSAFGLVAGWLFWRRGLEAAMIAHLMAHVVLWAASRLGVYF